MTPQDDADDRADESADPPAQNAEVTWEVRIDQDGFIRLAAEFVGPFLADRLAWERDKLAAIATPKKKVGRDTARSTGQPTWLGIPRAAELLDEEPESLRKKLERVARKGADGQIESDLSGLRGRKLGRLWKVQIPAGWASKAGR